jgi:hypothetical protein
LGICGWGTVTLSDAQMTGSEIIFTFQSGQTIRGIIIPQQSSLNSIPHRSIRLPEIKPFYLSLSDLAHDLRRPPRDDREARNDHVRRNHGAVQDPHEVLDDRELSHCYVAADVDVATDECCFDDGTGTDEDVVCDF